VHDAFVVEHIYQSISALLVLNIQQTNNRKYWTLLLYKQYTTLQMLLIMLR